MRKIMSLQSMETIEPNKATSVPFLRHLPIGTQLEPLDNCTESALANLLYASFKDSLDDQGESLADWEKEITATLKGKYGEILPCLSFGLFHQEVLVGTLITSLYRGVPLILYIAIHPDYQGGGHAKQLIQQAKQRLSESQTYQELFLVVAAGNTPAYNLYKKVGFIERGTNWETLLGN